MFLHAAGEFFQDGNIDYEKPDILKHIDVKTQLKHMCRESTRNHLLDLDPYTHLFNRIPQLGLPSSLIAYLLYHMSLDALPESLKS